MDDLFSDSDPEYRATRVRSGIPPPSIRDQRRQQHQQRQVGDLSRYNPSMRHQQRYSPYSQSDDRRQTNYHKSYSNDQRYPQQQQQRHPEQADHRPQRPPSQAVQSKAKTVDLRTSTDFLQCQQRLSLEEIVYAIQQEKHIADVDYDFLSSKGLVEKVNQLRERIRHVSTEQRSRARCKSNPFERVGNAIFMNRAATKLAALDATFGLTVTKNHREEFIFADICGGPGGFSEYLLWRVHSWGGSAHGYGITLNGSDEIKWHPERFIDDIPRHSLTTIDGVDGTGDLYRSENRESFASTVLKETKQGGVHVVVADGGFDFSGNEKQQEVVAQRLILCEIITMLLTLKQGGHFVCKFFDMLSTTTASFVWLLYQLFDEVCITKPLSSRPANAERYIVCKGLIHHRPTALISLLSDIASQSTCPSLFSRKRLENDEDFIDYIKMRNMKLTMKQTEALEQLVFFVDNPEAPSVYDQEQIKRACLSEWRLPLSSD
ncbi:Cap-specific mRNA (nucleoside-2'-O-)-methyltransferase 1 [Choanephora cucurbitarum]|uniref:Cap-specific mRNA (nucleoside-2'-O-)-methyltransferase 1 n=1 Tax=Choanephora cucurbitarum TaxID=101091 RepID=A0A1C7NJP6_9FUNG|nr:Cap-specific mRNA (nucleoside-2'-O-)-methyltransferase 1 [Choanephora cucurbitarum]